MCGEKMSKLAMPKHVCLEEFMTEEEKVLRDATRGFVDGVIMPIRQQVDADEREHKIIEPVMKQILVDFGAQRMVFPEKYGGLGLTSMRSFYWAGEELARGDSGMCVAALCAAWPLMPIIHEPYVREDLLEEFAKIFCKDELHFGCFAMTEPQGGCDIENVDVMKGRTIRTTATLEGDEWVINGEKQWPTNAGIASLYLTVCTTDPDLGEEGIALIYVPAPIKGLDFGDFEVKAGMAADRNCSIYFDNVRVPGRNLVGEVNGGWPWLDSRIAGKMIHFAGHLGRAQKLFDQLRDYAKERIQGGKPIFQHPNIAAMLGEAYLGIESTRAFFYKAAWECDRAELADGSSGVVDPSWGEGCFFLYKKLGLRLAEIATEVYGGIGGSIDMPLDKFIRRLFVGLPGGSTMNMNAVKVARHL